MMAESGQESPHVCRGAIPVWLPRISLTSLSSNAVPNLRAGVAQVNLAQS